MTLDKHLHNIIDWIFHKIEYPDNAENLYFPVRYTMEDGGKRLRPMLCLASCELCGSDPAKAVNQAVGIEMFHNFTLIHDDVMDKSKMRRGKETVFAKWGETQAILSGDALLTMATQKISDCDTVCLKEVLHIFNKTALEVYEGQQLDMDFENRDDVTTDEYLEMIRLKTSVLLGCACALGAIVSEADADKVQSLYMYGEKLGLAFQLRDDWLDTFGDSDTFGKIIGGDILNRKKTWLFITACEEAPIEITDAYKNEDRVIEKVRAVYDRLNLSERCDKLIKKFCDEAVDAVRKIDGSSDVKDMLIELAYRLCLRVK